MADSCPQVRGELHADMHDKTLTYYEHNVQPRTSLLTLKRAIVCSDTQSAGKRHVSLCSAPFHLRRSVDRAVRSAATLSTAHACMHIKDILTTAANTNPPSRGLHVCVCDKMHHRCELAYTSAAPPDASHRDPRSQLPKRHAGHDGPHHRPPSAYHGRALHVESDVFTRCSSRSDPLRREQHHTSKCSSCDLPGLGPGHGRRHHGRR
jgi:hypothetical protein